MFYKKKLFLKNSQYWQENICVKSVFNKVTDLKACNFIKNRLQHRCFPVHIAKFLGAPILKNNYERLLLKHCPDFIYIYIDFIHTDILENIHWRQSHEKQKSVPMKIYFIRLWYDFIFSQCKCKGLQRLSFLNIIFWLLLFQFCL